MKESVGMKLAELRLVPSTVLACSTLLIYDHLCTLDQEVAYVWGHPLTGGSILFILNRYLPYVDTFMSLNLQILSVNDPKSCLKQNTILTWFIVAGIIISETILVLRTYALWERRRLILVILCCNCAISYIPAIVITHLEVKSLKYIPSATPDKPGCRLGSASPIILVAYILLAFSETTVAVLTGIQAYRSLRFSRSRWIKQMYKDGLLFYLYLSVISLSNVFIPIFAPRQLANWLATPQRVLHSLLCTRVLLLILRQRTGSLTARVPAITNLESSAVPRFTSFMSENEETMDTNITVVSPLEVSSPGPSTRIMSVSSS